MINASDQGMMLRGSKSIGRDGSKSSEIKTESSIQKKWNYEENKAYVQFLVDHRRLMEFSSSRRSSKIFLQMSLNLRTKTPEQCRTHHQKLMAKYLSISAITNLFLNDFSSRQKKLPQKVILSISEQYVIYQASLMNFDIKLCPNSLQQW